MSGIYHVIFNPKAKNGKSKSILDKVCLHLKRAGKEYEVHETVFRGQAEEIVANLPVDAEELIVIGGDGTAHEVLNGLREPEKMKIALIPAGTGNDFCAGANIPTDVDKLMSIVLRGETKNTDYIEFNGRRCLNVGGLGMDVDVLERCNRGKMTGKIKYFLSLLASIFSFKGYQVRLSVNGEVITQKALFVAICNGDRFGGGINICPDAKVDDKKLEVVLVPAMGFFGIISTFIKLVTGKIFKAKNTLHYFCEQAEIVPDSPKTVQFDGELYENYRVLEGKIKSGLRFYR